MMTAHFDPYRFGPVSVEILAHIEAVERGWLDLMALCTERVNESGQDGDDLAFYYCHAEAERCRHAAETLRASNRRYVEPWEPTGVYDWRRMPAPDRWLIRGTLWGSFAVGFCTLAALMFNLI